MSTITWLWSSWICDFLYYYFQRLLQPLCKIFKPTLSRLVFVTDPLTVPPVPVPFDVLLVLDLVLNLGHVSSLILRSFHWRPQIVMDRVLLFVLIYNLRYITNISHKNYFNSLIIHWGTYNLPKETCKNLKIYKIQYDFISDKIYRKGEWRVKLLKE